VPLSGSLRSDRGKGICSSSETTREQLASVAVKNHHNATMNPKAQFRSEITVDMVLKSVMVADPLHILDCSPNH